jgi:molybdopterin molybdotransferase
VLGLLANQGMTTPLVYNLPGVTVLVTGDELVRPDAEPSSGQIRDSNSFSIAAALNCMGIGKVRLMRLDDDAVRIRAGLKKALEDSDVLISSGGVSVGRYDLIRPALEELGVQEMFWRVAIKPGKPLYFGLSETKRRTLVFGLPGNPVATLVCFHQIVKPALWKLMGRTGSGPRIFNAVLSERLKKKAGRLEFVRGRLERSGESLFVEPIARRSSHMLSGLARADCLIKFEAEKTFLEKGETVEVELIDWQL